MGKQWTDIAENGQQFLETCFVNFNKQILLCTQTAPPETHTRTHTHTHTRARAHARILTHIHTCARSPLTHSRKRARKGTFDNLFSSLTRVELKRPHYMIPLETNTYNREQNDSQEHAHFRINPLFCARKPHLTVVVWGPQESINFI